jgi:hypothetical protein
MGHDGAAAFHHYTVANETKLVDNNGLALVSHKAIQIMAHISKNIASI